MTFSNVHLERLNVSTILGIWIADDLTWSMNDDLIDVYKLFIRSLLEYCCVVFHSSLTHENIQDLERIQKTALRVVYGEDYEDYQSALHRSGLETLYSRHESRCLDFALKCVKRPLNSRLSVFTKNL